MKRHFILLDPLEKLSVKKDSTLLFAHTLKSEGIDCRLVFEQDLNFSNRAKSTVFGYTFDSKLMENSVYLDKFELAGGELCELGHGDVFHMRLDPPFDGRYLRYLWLLGALQAQGVQVVNDPAGVSRHNEKLYAYQNESSHPSFVGAGAKALESFLESLAAVQTFVLKPLDLYQGIGVEKVERAAVLERFKQKTQELNGPVIVQPYDRKVESGEVRSIYFKGQEIGSILKTPPRGEFLANIARGAEFKRYDLTQTERKLCDDVTKSLMKEGIDWVAFDLLGGMLSEVNITCPGLLVEVSQAYETNLAKKIIDLL